MKVRLMCILLGLLLTGVSTFISAAGAIKLIEKGTPSVLAYGAVPAAYFFAFLFIGMIVYLRFTSSKVSRTQSSPFVNLSLNRLGDKRAQFTVYRPRSVRPNVWYPMLAFAHLQQRDTSRENRDPARQVRQQAMNLLGAKFEFYQDITQTSARDIATDQEISFVPQIAGIEFNPRHRSFLWHESIHKEEFRMRASPDLEGSIATGRMSVFVGKILVADISLSIRVSADAEEMSENVPGEIASCRPYRKIFASYSHKDSSIVEAFATYAKALGDVYMRDVISLRAGEKWNERLKDMITDSDVFQLFWSSNSMRSPFVKKEWEYALSLGRANFIRPLYWEEPLPKDESQELPPESLRCLHFQRIPSSGERVEELEGTRAIGKSMDENSGFWPSARKAVLAVLPLILLMGWGAATWEGFYMHARLNNFSSSIEDFMKLQATELLLFTSIMSLLATLFLFISRAPRRALKHRFEWTKNLGIWFAAIFSLLLVSLPLPDTTSASSFFLELAHRLPRLLGVWMSYAWVHFIVISQWRNPDSS